MPIRSRRLTRGAVAAAVAALLVSPLQALPAVALGIGPEVTIAPEVSEVSEAGETNSGAAVAGSLTSPVPTISGSASINSTLKANAGSWGPAPVTLTYQWMRGNFVIAGATGKTYRLTADDVTEFVWVQVTGSKSGYATVVMPSDGKLVAPGTIATATAVDLRLSGNGVGAHRQPRRVDTGTHHDGLPVVPLGRGRCRRNRHHLPADRC